MSLPPVEPRLLGELTVVIIKARNLQDKSKVGKQSPYVVIKYREEKKKTQVKKKGGQHPEFDEEVRFKIYEDAEDIVRRPKSSTDTVEGSAPVPNAGDATDPTAGKTALPPIPGEKRTPSGKGMIVQVWADDVKEPKLVGETVVDLTTVFKLGEHDETFPLTYKERDAGEICLELTYFINGAPPIPKKVARPVARVDYSGPGVFQASGLPSIVSSPDIQRKPYASASMSNLRPAGDSRSGPENHRLSGGSWGLNAKGVKMPGSDLINGSADFRPGSARPASGVYSQASLASRVSRNDSRGSHSGALEEGMAGMSLRDGIGGPTTVSHAHRHSVPNASALVSSESARLRTPPRPYSAAFPPSSSFPQLQTSSPVSPNPSMKVSATQQFAMPPPIPEEQAGPSYSQPQMGRSPIPALPRAEQWSGYQESIVRASLPTPIPTTYSSPSLDGSYLNHDERVGSLPSRPVTGVSMPVPDAQTYRAPMPGPSTYTTPTLPTVPHHLRRPLPGDSPSSHRPTSSTGHYPIPTSSFHRSTDASDGNGPSMPSWSPSPVPQPPTVPPRPHSAMDSTSEPAYVNPVTSSGWNGSTYPVSAPPGPNYAGRPISPAAPASMATVDANVRQASPSPGHPIRGSDYLASLPVTLDPPAPTGAYVKRQPSPASSYGQVQSIPDNTPGSALAHRQQYSNVPPTQSFPAGWPVIPPPPPRSGHGVSSPGNPEAQGYPYPPAHGYVSPPPVISNGATYPR